MQALLSNLLNQIALYFDTLLYWALIKTHGIFRSFYTVSIYNYGLLDDLIDNFFVVFGLFMVLFISFKIITFIVDPSSDKTAERAKTIVKKTGIAVFLVIAMPLIFDYLHILQVNIIDSGFIENMILGQSKVESVENNREKAGISLALSLAQTFYHPVYKSGDGYVSLSIGDCQTHEEAKELDICVTYVNAYNSAYENNNISYLLEDPDLRSAISKSSKESSYMESDKQMNYIPFLSGLAAIGGLAFMMVIALYTATRIFKLAILQIIAPIAILKNIVEDEDLTDTKWFIEIKDTYLSIFAYLAVLSFVFFIMGIIPSIVKAILSDATGNSLGVNFVLLVSLMIFVKDIPKLIKATLGGSGNFFKKMKEDLRPAAAATTAIGAGAGAYHGAKSAYDATGGGVKGGVAAALGGTLGSVAGGVHGNYRGHKDDPSSIKDVLASGASGADALDGLVTGTKDNFERFHAGGDNIGERVGNIFRQGKYREKSEQLGKMTDSIKAHNDGYGASKVKAIDTKYSTLESQVKQGTITDGRILSRYVAELEGIENQNEIQFETEKSTKLNSINSEIISTQQQLEASQEMDLSVASPEVRQRQQERQGQLRSKLSNLTTEKENLVTSSYEKKAITSASLNDYIREHKSEEVLESLNIDKHEEKSKERLKEARKKPKEVLSRDFNNMSKKLKENINGLSIEDKQLINKELTKKSEKYNKEYSEGFNKLMSSVVDPNISDTQRKKLTSDFQRKWDIKNKEFENTLNSLSNDITNNNISMDQALEKGILLQEKQLYKTLDEVIKASTEFSKEVSMNGITTELENDYLALSDSLTTVNKEGNNIKLVTDTQLFKTVAKAPKDKK